MEDTIYSLSTAQGRGALAVIRVSGPLAKIASKELTGDPSPTPRMALLRNFKDIKTRKPIDKGLLIFFNGPASYTGEDMAEFHLHGGIAIVRAIIENLSSIKGLRQAEPGEFTRRAFENGKMDLTESEAVADLIDAETQVQREQAYSQMEGALSSLYNGWRNDLGNILAKMEADLDFSDEDLPENLIGETDKSLKKLLASITEHLDDNHRGERLRNGINIAILGAPNAGKSSLVNALTQREAAIVSEFAGTTRDIIEVHLDLGGYPVILSDTAGLKEEQEALNDQDKIEREGINRALRRAEEADLKIIMFDGNALPRLDKGTLSLRDENTIIAISKSDLKKGETPDEIKEQAIHVSASTGEGLNNLTKEIIKKLETFLGSKEDASLTRSRHRRHLEECKNCLLRSRETKLPELAAEDVRLAMRALGKITGRVDVEELLDIIFRDFCIGK